MLSAIKTLGFSLINEFKQPFKLNKQLYSHFSSCISYVPRPLVQNIPKNMFAQPSSSKPLLLQPGNTSLDLSRNVTKLSLKTGKKKSVSAAVDRFYRLNCGLWIRRRAGCHKRLHKKNTQTRYNLVQHVVCTKTQCMMLDKMTTAYYKKRKYYIDDPFEPYHERNNFDWVLPVRRR